MIYTEKKKNKSSEIDQLEDYSWSRKEIKQNSFNFTKLCKNEIDK